MLRRRDDGMLYRRPAELPKVSRSRHQELKSTSLTHGGPQAEQESEGDTGTVKEMKGDEDED